MCISVCVCTFCRCFWVCLGVWEVCVLVCVCVYMYVQVLTSFRCRKVLNETMRALMLWCWEAPGAAGLSSAGEGGPAAERPPGAPQCPGPVLRSMSPEAHSGSTACNSNTHSEVENLYSSCCFFHGWSWFSEVHGWQPEYEQCFNAL